MTQNAPRVSLPIVMNPYHDFAEFTLPVPSGGGGWKLILDTNATEQTPGFAGMTRRSMRRYRALLGDFRIAASLKDHVAHTFSESDRKADSRDPMRA
jgi:hypothetical protein